MLVEGGFLINAYMYDGGDLVQSANRVFVLYRMLILFSADGSSNCQGETDCHLDCTERRTVPVRVVYDLANNSH